MTARPLAPVVLALVLALTQCTSPESTTFAAKVVYHTSGLIVEQVSPNAFVHTSFKQTNDFGNVPCNGLVVRNGGEAIVFDTPTNDTSAAEPGRKRPQ